MDQNYIDIAAHVENAKRLRSQALAEFISAGLAGLKRFLTVIQYPKMPRNTVVTNRSAYMDPQYFP
jgi:hypothetical protein